MSKYYCEECRKMVPYTVLVDNVTEEVSGRIISYKSKIVECKFCGTEVDAESVAEDNLAARNAAIRELK